MQKLADLMQKEMTRKEFVTTLGAGVATIFGFSTFIELLNKNSSQRIGMVAHGYGGGPYGGGAKHVG